MNTENEITNLSVNEKVASEIEQTQTEVQVGVDAPAQPEASDVSHVKVSGSLTKATMIPFKDHKQGEIVHLKNRPWVVNIHIFFPMKYE